MRKRQWATIVTGLALLLLGMTDAAATVYFIHADHLGTPQAVTDSSGVVKWRADIDPFGKATIITSTLPSNLSMNLRFPGQYYDSETGLYDNHFRTYDPVAGRYLQSDPIGLAGGINTYAYVGNNPIRTVDPSGLAGVAFGYSGSAAAPLLGGNASGMVAFGNDQGYVKFKAWHSEQITANSIGLSAGRGLAGAVFACDISEMKSGSSFNFEIGRAHV